MDDRITDKARDSALRPKPKISADEMDRRREALRRADAHNRIEGIYRNPESDAIFEAHIRGDIELPEVLARLKAQPVPR